MVFRQFYFRILFKVLLLVVATGVFFFLVFTTGFFVTAGLLVLLIIYETWSLIRLVNSTNRQVSSFLEAIRFEDFSRDFEVEDPSNSFGNLNRAFQEVFRQFRKVREEKEHQVHFLNNIVQHIGIGLLAYRSDGRIELINNAAKRLFGISDLRHIDHLADRSEELVSQLRRMRNGQNCLVKIPSDLEELQLLILGREFKLGQNLMTLVSIQNIQNELEEKEMDAWQKLIRVLTHEIMNSMTPIVSLTTSSSALLQEIRQEAGECSENVNEILDDLETSIRVINGRSTGLMHFVELYRNLTRIPRPNFRIFYVGEFFRNIFKLFESQFLEKGIVCTMEIQPEDLEITADQELLEQVVINMIRNSIQALEMAPQPRIVVRAYIHETGRLFIEIEDNGEGILPEVLERIFVPFFTTKTDGSGIGLSLSKQILRLHGGNIFVHSVPNQRTVFYLKF